MLKKLIVSALSFYGLGVFGQNLDYLYKMAQSDFLDEELVAAGILYQQIVDQDSDYKDSQYRLEICQLLTFERNKEMDKILSYSDTYGKTDKFYNYWLGRIYADKYQFRDAIRAWKRLLEGKGQLSRKIRQEVSDFIVESEGLIAMFDNPGDYAIHQLGEEINTSFDEVTPVFFDDKQELLYASSKGSTNKHEPIFLIYHSQQVDKNWTSPTQIEELGQFDKDEVNLELINSERKLFQFRSGRGGDLYFSEPTEAGWSLPQEFDNKITKANIQSHFFINEHEDRIIFTSDQYFTKEGLELYQSYKDPKNGEWTKPTLLSPHISSSSDEDTPYLSPDEKSFYFSSNRPGGLGGYDIYVSRLDSETNSWSEPENMGFPINSPDDELHFKMNFDQTSGYFSSSRFHSNGGYDIYFFKEIQKVDITGRVVDLATKLPAMGVSVSFRPSQYIDAYFRSEVDGQGNYRARITSDEIFKVEIERNGQILYTDEYEVHDTEGVATTYHQDFFIGEGEAIEVAEYEGPAETESTIEQLGSKFRPGRKSVARNIYFNHGTSELQKTSIPHLEVLLKTMQKSLDLKIEVAGHTDNTGPPSVNEWLSYRRAEAIQKWLIGRGVEASRITPKGYGETKPIASNDDEKDGRELNRRIEIIVIE